MKTGAPAVVAALAALAAMTLAARADAQAPDPDTRAAAIEQAQAAKAAELHPYVPSAGERYLNYAEAVLTGGGSHLHPWFENAYSGGGFTLGAGYLYFVGATNTIDVRGSVTPSGYTRVEAEFLAPRLLHRQARLSVLGGWRDATEVGYYGLGSSTTEDARANYGFEQPYGVATLEVRPARRLLVLRGGVEASEWHQTRGSGSVPSVEDVYTPETLPGLGATVAYLHTQGTVGLDWRPSPGYARRGGFYGVTLHDFHDVDGAYGFTRVDYEAVQHVPILRESWVLSLHAEVSTTAVADGQEIPFFMLPSLGGGSSLRAYSSWRFRDRNSLLLQGEWRVIANRFLDLAAFYDAGKVTAHTRDLDLSGLTSGYGVGVRFHGPLTTPLRIDVANGPEGLSLVWAASAPF